MVAEKRRARLEEKRKVGEASTGEEAEKDGAKQMKVIVKKASGKICSVDKSAKIKKVVEKPRQEGRSRLDCLFVTYPLDRMG